MINSCKLRTIINHASFEGFPEIWENLQYMQCLILKFKLEMGNIKGEGGDFQKWFYYFIDFPLIDGISVHLDKY